jgi:hypothetical protein
MVAQNPGIHGSSENEVPDMRKSFRVVQNQKRTGIHGSAATRGALLWE